MRRNRFRPGDDAVSPVVGVVLLVGIAVLLTTSVGVFVLGFGPGESAPETEVQFHQESGSVVTTMVRPADILEEDVTVQVNGEPACTPSGGTPWGGSGSIDRAETVEIAGYGSSCGNTLTSGDTVRVIWEAPGGGRSEIVGEYEVV